MNHDYAWKRSTTQSLTTIAVACLLLACDSDSSTKNSVTADASTHDDKHDAATAESHDDTSDKPDNAAKPSDAGTTEAHDAAPSEMQDAAPSEMQDAAPSEMQDAGPSDTNKQDAAPSDTDKQDAAQPETHDAGPAASKPLYALAVLVFGPDTTSTYVSVFDSLDITSIDLTKAREFAGQADIATYGGKLFVSDGENPVVHRYTVGDDGKLNDDGSVSFASLGIESIGLRDNIFISATKAYVASDAGYAIWNPTSMELAGEVTVKELEGDHGDMTVDGSPGVLRGDHLYKAYYWEDWSTYTFSKEQYVVTFDTKNDKVINAVSEERCPNLGAPAQLDEDGTVYFSNWYYNVPGTLMNGAPHSCALRILKDTDAIDPNWTLRFDEIAKGHEGSQLSYISKGQAVFSIFHQEDFTIIKDTEPYDIPASVNWETWTLDLKDTSTAKPIAGMDRMTAQQTVFTLDGRTFVLAPGMDWETTKAYEVLPNAQSRLAFTIAGWSRGFFKIK